MVDLKQPIKEMFKISSTQHEVSQINERPLWPCSTAQLLDLKQIQRTQYLDKRRKP